ncbi:hypothetical protein F2Q68_00017253 [Brassica cretica]|uniref:Uncharacterized protein n=1 Tax=Brassica cretica TaxID=69181 RepID=A0A8S9HE81_BRACR|nr:hypothetical protein F2Q68_00017253 [Brassica cretica]
MSTGANRVIVLSCRSISSKKSRSSHPHLNSISSKIIFAYTSDEVRFTLNGSGRKAASPIIFYCSNFYNICEKITAISKSYG